MRHQVAQPFQVYRKGQNGHGAVGDRDKGLALVAAAARTGPVVPYATNCFLYAPGVTPSYFLNSAWK